MLYFYNIKQDYLRFTGNDKLDLINRLSTNEVNSLQKNFWVKTILTSDKGKIIDVLTLFNKQDYILALCSFNNSNRVLEHLEKYTIMDDFYTENLSDNYKSILLWGYKAESFINELTTINCNDIPKNGFLQTENYSFIIYKTDEFSEGFMIIYSIKTAEYLEEKFKDTNIINRFNMQEINDNQFDIIRTESGIPIFGKEINEHVNPLECGLEKYVSFTKGCYIGQEVIARLDAYDKISKHLIGLKILGDITDYDANYKITIEGKECGFVTSIVKSEKFGIIGLGYIKTIFLDYTKNYKIKTESKEYNCSIIKLPFTLQ